MQYTEIDADHRRNGEYAEKNDVLYALHGRRRGSCYGISTATSDISSAAGPWRNAATRLTISCVIACKGSLEVSRTISASPSTPSISSRVLKLSVKPSV